MFFLNFSIILTILLTIFFFRHAVAAVFVGAEELVSLLHHIVTALRALDLRGLLPGHKFTLRIVDTAVIFSSLFGLFDHHIPAAERTFHADLFKIRLGVLALRESGTGQEFSVGAVFDHHVAATELADLIRHLV